MASNLDLVAPVFATMPSDKPGLTPADEGAIRRLEAALGEIAAPGLEVVMVSPDVSFRAEHEGTAGFVEAWREWLSPFRSYRIEPEDMFEAGDVVVTFGRQFAIPVGSDIEVESAGAAVWWFRDGRLTRVEFHLDRELAMRAAGLAE